MNFFKKNINTVLIFLLLVVIGFSTTFTINGIVEWPFLFYLLNYGIGNSSRLFIGSLFSIVSPNNYIEMLTVAHFVYGYTVFLCLIISIYLGGLLKKSEKAPKKYGIIALIFLYLALPLRFSVYLNYYFAGYLEIYSYGILFLNLFLLAKCKQDWKLWLVISALSSLTILIHQVSYLLIFPILLATLFYNIFEKNFKKSVIVGSIFVVIVTSFLFVFYQFNSSINVKNANTLVYMSQKRTDIELTPFAYDAYKCEYFQDTKTKLFNTMKIAIKKNFKAFDLISAFLVFLPATLFLFGIWKEIFSRAEKIQKIKYTLMLGCSTFYLPLFALACDWGRWMIGLTLFEFLILFWMYEKDEVVQNSIEKFGEFAQQNIVMLTLYAFLIITIHPNLFNMVRAFYWMY